MNMIRFNGSAGTKVRNTVIILTLIFASTFASFGQREREEAPPLRERLFFGGSLGLQFGTITDIEISPVAGLWVLPRVAVAVGPDYRYYKFRDTETNIYGGRGYVQFMVVQNLNNILPLGANTGIFLQLQNELLSLQSSFWKIAPYASERFYVNTVLAGPGISQQMGRRSSMNLAVLWPLNDSVYDLYSSPEFRIIFTF